MYFVFSFGTLLQGATLTQRTLVPSGSLGRLIKRDGECAVRKEEAKPLYIQAAEERASELGVPVSELLTDDELFIPDQPGCLDPGEIREFVRDNVLDASRREHLDNCEDCQALVQAAFVLCPEAEARLLAEIQELVTAVQERPQLRTALGLAGNLSAMEAVALAFEVSKATTISEVATTAVGVELELNPEFYRAAAQSVNVWLSASSLDEADRDDVDYAKLLLQWLKGHSPSVPVLAAQLKSRHS
jgi:hypothetical protein